MSLIRVFGSVLAMVLVATGVSCGSDDEGSSGAGGSSGASGAAGGGGSTGGTGGGSAGTGGETGGAAGTAGTAGSTTGTCATACANIALASCPEEEDEAACTAGCEGERSTLTGCDAEFAAMAGCVSSAEVTCDADGFAVFPACDNQELAYVSCSACLQASGDSACDSCLKQSCCDEVTAVRTDPDFETFLECADSCTDEGCVNGCIASYPSAASSFDAYNQCQDANCMTDCFG